MHNTIQDLQIIKALNDQCRQKNVPTIKSCRWLLPNDEEVKACCDGSAMGNPGPASIGILYRNNAGEVLGTFSKAIGNNRNYMAEVQAIIQGASTSFRKRVKAAMDGFGFKYNNISL
ncbi:hypothetical protein GIB67_021671 [Kingdonia uniflora]|uniref:RNase H type-1 domain-containing protein n=1 Tax=Kingdonia uniflora TaxID=39325 RepID=A0A7J7LLV7_9MAGN|nr:hypothetical protein GIB67_021671 [Kingdonia uniflora]